MDMRSKVKYALKECREFGCRAPVYHYMMRRSKNPEKYYYYYLSERNRKYMLLNKEELYHETALLYKTLMGRKMNQKNPVLFTEKIQWLKIYGDTDIRTKLSDKYRVRNYVDKKLGGGWKAFSSAY